MPLSDTGLKVQVDLIANWSVYDEFMYAVVAAIPYENEGTVAPVVGSAGQIRLTTGAVAGNRARINLSQTQVPINPQVQGFYSILGLFGSLVNDFHFVGLMGVVPTAANPPVEPLDAIYFRRKDTATTAHWFAVCRHAGVETAIDTGIVGDTQPHLFNIIIQGDGNPVVQFYIDNVLVATISGQGVPTNSLVAGVVVVTGEAVAKIIQIDAWQLSNARIASGHF